MLNFLQLVRKSKLSQKVFSRCRSNKQRFSSIWTKTTSFGQTTFQSIGLRHLPHLLCQFGLNRKVKRSGPNKGAKTRSYINHQSEEYRSCCKLGSTLMGVYKSSSVWCSVCRSVPPAGHGCDSHTEAGGSEVSAAWWRWQSSSPRRPGSCLRCWAGRLLRWSVHRRRPHAGKRWRPSWWRTRPRWAALSHPPSWPRWSLWLHRYKHQRQTEDPVQSLIMCCSAWIACLSNLCC